VLGVEPSDGVAASAFGFAAVGTGRGIARQTVDHRDAGRKRIEAAVGEKAYDEARRLAADLDRELGEVSKALTRRHKDAPEEIGG